ncbi:MAG: heme exporter protein D [Paraglaciecola sp.]|jgi:heme exporter protein D
MHFDSWQAFWAMGDYGLYVWLSFGGSILALLILSADSLLARRSLLARVQSEVARKKRIQQAQTAQKLAQQSALKRSEELVNEP